MFYNISNIVYGISTRFFLNPNGFSAMTKLLEYLVYYCSLFDSDHKDPYTTNRTEKKLHNKSTNYTRRRHYYNMKVSIYEQANNKQINAINAAGTLAYIPVRCILNVGS